MTDIYFRGGMDDTIFKYERCTHRLLLKHYDSDDKWVPVRYNANLKIIKKEYNLKRLTRGEMMLELL